MPARKPKRRRLGVGDGSCIRLRPMHQNHVWSYDFVMDRTADGRAIRMLTVVDEFTRECLAIDVARALTSEDVLEQPSDLFVRRVVPDYIRSDNGSKFTAKRVRVWLSRFGVKALSIEPGSPWENAYVESFKGCECRCPCCRRYPERFLFRWCDCRAGCGGRTAHREWLDAGLPTRHCDSGMAPAEPRVVRLEPSRPFSVQPHHPALWRPGAVARPLCRRNAWRRVSSRASHPCRCHGRTQGNPCGY